MASIRIFPAVIMAAFILLRCRFSHAAARSAAAFVSSSRTFSSTVSIPSAKVTTAVKNKNKKRGPSSSSSTILQSTTTSQSFDSSSPTSSPAVELELFKVNLLTLPLPELESIIKSWGFPAFRARQINNWIFNQGVSDIDEMTDLPLKLRTVLKERATIGSLHLEIEQVSNDGTRKRAYKLHDGQIIESVLMPYEDGRRTACISSQAGCAMGEYILDFAMLQHDQTEYQATELMINEELPTCRDRRRNALISLYCIGLDSLRTMQ
jgi:hypothetical protein